MRKFLFLIFVLIFNIIILAGAFKEESYCEEAQPGGTDRTSSGEMVFIPAGEFIMGSEFTEDESPVRNVKLSAFFIDKFEITNGEYKKFRDTHFFLPEKAKHPVVNVSWFDAKAYCKSMGKRLPTEAEWERAAKGTGNFLYPWGNEFVQGNSNCLEAGNNGSVMVGSFPRGASTFGCYDMSGNVWEWVEDWYQSYTGSEAKEKAFGEVYKVIRGGAWNLTGRLSRSSNRLYSRPDYWSSDIGFRCAKNP